MCILAVKKKGVLCPNRDTLRVMYNNNPHGAGVAYAVKGRLIVKKGLMTFEDFANAVEEIPTEATALIHCRISTSAGRGAEMTHPFRLTDSVSELRKTQALYKKGRVVAHNGIFSEFGNRADINDTCEFIINYLCPLDKVGGGALRDDYDSIIDTLVTGSRLAILDASGQVKMYGMGWEFNKGLWYSNTSYKQAKTYYTTGWGKVYKDYDDYEEDKYYTQRAKAYNKTASESKKDDKTTGEKPICYGEDYQKETAGSKEKDKEIDELCKTNEYFKQCIDEYTSVYNFSKYEVLYWFENGWL